MTLPDDGLLPGLAVAQWEDVGGKPLFGLIDAKGRRVAEPVYEEMPGWWEDISDAREFDDLPADADESTRQDLAERLVPYIRAINEAHPGLIEARTDAPGGARRADRTIADAMAELYNAAQLDVLARAREILRGSAR